MLGLPKRTELNNGEGKKIPKEKFYSKLSLTSSQERMFIDTISSIRWMNKISPESMNLSTSDDIQEIEVFEIILKSDNIEEKLLKIIDEAIIHPILFVVKSDSKEKLFISFKENNAAGKTIVKKYYSTEWCTIDQNSLDFSSLSLGELYKNLILQISDEHFVTDANSDLPIIVARDVEYQKALKDIEVLENKLKKTVQPNKKLDLVHSIRELKNKWGVN